ncbi:hypothetical protein C491_09684 [Natronococcus amylolyticus DSM 10524]|uniref:Uncharacterized protein n=1 Tax=Natronococcus amylolyticus DSM 10524 TaxID=1227497 RepID=L9X9G3_9EURY|nr:hypothetical protein [Natronococcus amylolyticus]ELY58056.1 hypothetical protein C491_09684 [Natronococcus amylolyticus DSM 10524]
MTDEDVLLRLNVIIGLLVILLAIQLSAIFPFGVLSFVIALTILFAPGLFLLLRHSESASSVR